MELNKEKNVPPSAGLVEIVPLQPPAAARDGGLFSWEEWWGGCTRSPNNVHSLWIQDSSPEGYVRETIQKKRKPHVQRYSVRRLHLKSTCFLVHTKESSMQIIIWQFHIILNNH